MFKSDPAPNYTPRAQQTLSLARKEAGRLNHNYVGTEHVLLGLIRLGQSVAFNVLQRLGVELDALRIEIEKQVGKGPDQKIIGHIPYTPRVKKVLALAAKEAKSLGHTYLGTDHILLGLLREGEGIAGRVLKSLGINIEQTRQEILKELDPTLKESAPNLLPMFTPRAQTALGLARREADSFNHAWVGSEHILLGLMVLGQGVSVTVLQRLGLDLESVRAEVRKRHPAPEPGPLVPGTLPTTPRARQTLAHAAQDAKNLGHTYVGTEHILLGLLLEKEGHAAEILKAFGVDPSATRQAILAELAPPPLSQGQTPPPEPGQPG